MEIETRSFQSSLSAELPPLGPGGPEAGDPKAARGHDDAATPRCGDAETRRPPQATTTRPTTPRCRREATSHDGWWQGAHQPS
jgi:hypothetical protein